MAVRLSRALGASPEFWLNAKLMWELSQVDSDKHAEIQAIN